MIDDTTFIVFMIGFAVILCIIDHRHFNQQRTNEDLSNQIYLLKQEITKMTTNTIRDSSKADANLNYFRKAEINNTQMMNTAISNIIGNIELLMTAYEPTSSEYANLQSIKEEMEILSKELVRWQYH